MHAVKLFDAYIATPYSDPDPCIQWDRFHRVSYFAGILKKSGLTVYSPVSMTHPIAEIAGIEGSYEAWKGDAERTVALCTSLIVLQLPGWDKSIGVADEIRIAGEFEIPVNYTRWRDEWEKAVRKWANDR